MPQISVLLPCYNAASTLDEALESLRRQTFSDFEVIAVDDGSTDHSHEILQAWARRDRRFHVLSGEHGGILDALNRGLAACCAPLIARMDADDRSHPQRLERQLAYLQEHPQITVVGCLVQGFPPGQVRQGFKIYIDWLNSLVSDADIQREMFVESPLAHPSVIFRREWVERAGGYQEHGWPEDYDLWLRLYLAGAHFGKVGEVLLDWREYPERLTRQDSRYALENFLRAKAHYLMQGPLSERQTVFIWGAGMYGRRLSKHLLRAGCRLRAFFDVDPHKIGSQRRGLPILPPEDLPGRWSQAERPVVLAAVGARGARQIVRQRLNGFGLIEGKDWLAVA